MLTETIYTVLKDSTLQTHEVIKVILENDKKSIVEYLLDPNTVIALFAIGISLIGLIFTVIFNRKTLKLTIKHNELSLMPNLAWFHDPSNGKDILTLKNCGPGPCKLISIKFLYKRKEFETIAHILNLKIPELDSKLKKEENIVHLSIEGEILGDNESRILFNFNWEEDKSKELAFSIYEECKLSIHYESVYGNKLEKTEAFKRKLVI